MKEGTTITKLVMLFLVGCLVLYFGVYIWRGLVDPLATTVAYPYTINDSVETDGFLIRQEQVLPTHSGIVKVAPGEGERVGTGQTVAVVYRDGQALAREDEIRALELETELLQYATTRPEQAAGSIQLEDEVFRAVVALRASAAGGEFGQLDEQVLDVKRAVLRRDYTYGQGVQPGKLAELNARLSQLRGQAAVDTNRVKAQQSGVYSALVDGYEAVATPQTAMQLTTSGLEELFEQEATPQDDSLGKLITSNRWYLAVVLTQEQAQRLQKQRDAGQSIYVGFTGNFERRVEMRLEHVSKPEDGRCAVVLSTDRYLSATTLLRKQTVEVIFTTEEGLRVPKDTVHIITETTRDEQGNPVQTTRTGVYAVVRGQAEFKHVEVLDEGREFYVVRPLGPDKTALRAGDEIIVHGKNLHDGKVVIE